VSALRYVLGSTLSPAVQRECLSKYVHRYTGDHRPLWALNAQRHATNCTVNLGKRCSCDAPVQTPVQFKDDADWLANTRFAVRKDGQLDNRATFCLSNPTWPNGRPASMACFQTFTGEKK
jgi:hypothetical protein